jgi:hypothetical protein
MYYINQIFWVNFLLFIWFNTDAFIDYSSAFGLGSILKIKKFKEYKESDPRSDYLNFIRIKYPNFITKLISCKPCICFWFVLSISLFFNSILYFAPIYLVSYILYRLLDKYIY